jgi:hypothetical protein
MVSSKREVKAMINIRSIRKLQDNDGMTLKKGVKVTYKTGYQVADYGIECRTAEEAIMAVKLYGGDCGVWYAGGIYYIDHSFRISTKKEALRIGREHHQISILKWEGMKLIYC